ncbi:hypothetical protein ABZ570_20700 [Micromonospora sp. NPDC007271]|uniref:hypothetical protein n=1 Tax=Micromonospora sp. NPDC007271 TaxID=3154587 RepID=UPI0033EEB490
MLALPDGPRSHDTFVASGTRPGQSTWPKFSWHPTERLYPEREHPTTFETHPRGGAGMPQLRRHVLVAIIGAVLAAALGVGVWLLWPATAAPPAPTNAVVVRKPADPGEQARIAAVAELAERLPAAVARGDTSVWSAATRERFADLSATLPTGSTVTVDRATWRRTGAVASVEVTVAGGDQAPRRYTLVVVHEDGTWRVSGTFRLEQP